MDDMPLRRHDQQSDVLSAKVISMVVLGTASFLIGILPIKVLKFATASKNANNRKNLLISLMLCFGGGVLLFTTFIHLQPEVRTSFVALNINEKLATYVGVSAEELPLSELVFCVGFFFVYLIEEFAHLLLHSKQKDEILHRSLSVRCPKNDLQNPQFGIIPRVSLGCKEQNEECAISSKNDNYDTPHNEHFHGNLQKSFSGLLAILALSFHAIFEGLAVGLENDQEKVWYLFLAIATHKLVIAFCLGTELVGSNTKAGLTIFYILTFSIVTPLGIGIGLLLTETGSGFDITAAVLQGMAAGTLLYVVFFEVLARERDNEHSGTYQLLAILLGFALMTALQITTGHHHHHHHGDSPIHDHDHAHSDHSGELHHDEISTLFT